MNKLIDIIWKANPQDIKLEDVEAIRKMVIQEKELITHPSELGQRPIEIAKQKGIKRFEIAIARNTNYQAYYSKEELEQLLIDYISELSEQYYCAGWMAGIEHELWELLHQPWEQMEEFYQKRVQAEDIADLQWLATLTGSWAIWEEAQPITIGIQDWKLLFESWKQRRDERRLREVEPQYRAYQVEIEDWEKGVPAEEKLLIDYVIKYGGSYRLPEEEQALRRLFDSEAYLQKLVDNPIEREHYGLNHEKTNQLAKLSADELRKHITERILKEYSRELLNWCPNCGKLARTPQAKQCRFCHYDWH